MEVSKDQGMEEQGENKQRSRHGGTRRNLSKDQGMGELGEYKHRSGHRGT